MPAPYRPASAATWTVKRAFSGTRPNPSGASGEGAARVHSPVAQGEAADADAHLELGGLEKRVRELGGAPDVEGVCCAGLAYGDELAATARAGRRT
jgi:hypothetical protein